MLPKLVDIRTSFGKSWLTHPHHTCRFGSPGPVVPKHGQFTFPPPADFVMFDFCIPAGAIRLVRDLSSEPSPLCDELSSIPFRDGLRRRLTKE